MNNDEKIKLLASGDYFLYAHIIDNSWYFPDDQKVRCDIKSVVVHKDDKEIADAVINDNSVIVEQYVKIAKKWVSFLGSHVEHGFFNTYTHTATYKLKPQKQLKQICDNPDVNALYLHSINDLDNLPIPSDELTLKEILQDVQGKRISVDASELLIKARFKINEG